MHISFSTKFIILIFTCGLLMLLTPEPNAMPLSAYLTDTAGVESSASTWGHASHGLIVLLLTAIAAFKTKKG